MSTLKAVDAIYRRAKEAGVGETVFPRWQDKVLRASLREFKEAGIAVPVWSELLGETIYFVSDASHAVEGYVCYTADELARLLISPPGPEGLRAVHEAKRQLDGTVVDPPAKVAEFFKPYLLAPRDDVDPVPARLALGALAGRVASCTGCRLHLTRTRSVLGEGHPAARVMLVGEGPGKQEDITGRPFVGKAGKVLDQLLKSIGLRRQDVYIANTVKCRPRTPEDENRQPDEEEVEACRRFLEQQLLIVDPEVVVTLGAVPLQWFLPRCSVGEVHGRPREADGLVIFPTYHPAATFRKPELREVLKEDFMKLKEGAQ